MPYHVGKKGSNGCSGYPVVSADGKVMGCHPTEEHANSQVAALYANEPGLNKGQMEYMPCTPGSTKCDNPDCLMCAMKGTGMQDEDMTKRDFSSKERQRMAHEGTAMPDGSFPISNATDLHNAIQSVGRAKDYEAAKRHIISRARVLGLTRQLPEDWKNSVKKTMWGGTLLDLTGWVK